MVDGDGIERERERDGQAGRLTRCLAPTQEMELTDSLSRTYTGQEMEDAPGLSGLADEFDFGAIGDELGPEVRHSEY